MTKAKKTTKLVDDSVSYRLQICMLKLFGYAKQLLPIWTEAVKWAKGQQHRSMGLQVKDSTSIGSSGKALQISNTER